MNASVQARADPPESFEHSDALDYSASFGPSERIGPSQGLEPYGSFETLEDSEPPESLEPSAADLECPDVNITVAYNILISPDQDWKFLVSNQLQDVAATGIHHCARMLIAISVPAQHDKNTYLELQMLMRQAVSFVREHRAGRKALIIQEHENDTEYPAIRSIYRIAHSDVEEEVAHNHLFVYFHSMGMDTQGALKTRVDKEALDPTFVPWRALVLQFMFYDDIRAAAWLPSKLGWGWFNFWWARGRPLASHLPFSVTAYTLV
jgi:hypothetical protein